MTRPAERHATASLSPTGNTARDGNVAIREEFDHAQRLGTAEAWRLFIARHPDHALTEKAFRVLRDIEGDRPQRSR